jgi:hypothetical protein
MVVSEPQPGWRQQYLASFREMCELLHTSPNWNRNFQQIHPDAGMAHPISTTAVGKCESFPGL